MPKILIVDDTEMNRTMLAHRLQKCGFATATAADGMQALEAARREMPDLILMDMDMPVMDGREATRALKADASLAAIPVIALTANTDEGDRERAAAAGCDDYDTKPADWPRLLGKIAKFLPPP